ncbi:MAG: peptidoglycan DD-metalloendopeptidase family protein [Verrucomicrobiae bacterium]|nr:peptidoglycan DD-metalloendopeptidase family protein [Verrucomicrobiae bacterium]
MSRHRFIPQLAFAMLWSAATVLAADDDYARVARRFFAAINAQDHDKIRQMFTQQLRVAFPEARQRQYFASMLAQRGKVLGIVETTPSGAGAVVRLLAERGEWNLALTLDRKGLISAFNVTPAGPIVPLPERNATQMRLPVNGEWYVLWGGATEEQNRHARTRSQRRALDLLIRDAQGKSFQGDGKRNEDYYAYGKEVLAPADGAVILAIDGVPDNKPDSPNNFMALGNCIMIQHAESEFSLLAHLQMGSLLVKPGSPVKIGQPIARCGNSGNSSEPHLHFHLQNLPVLQEGIGFPPVFQNIRVTTGGRVRVEKEYSPVRGDTVAQESAEPPAKAAR